MFHKLITKYGLAAHLALLASLPLALCPFVSTHSLAVTILWLSGIALVWIFLEPSILAGEHLSEARARVRSEMLVDPLFWFFIIVIIFTGIRWLNSGVAMQYDPEQMAWRVAMPTFEAMPASVGDAGFLPFAVAVGIGVLGIGILHGLGLAARLSFGLVSSFLLGMGGVACVTCACCGMKPFVAHATAGFQNGPFWGTFFGIGLVTSIASGAQAEARKWAYARLPFCLAVAGNGAGLIFFAPPFVAAGYGAFAGVFLLLSLVFLSRAGSMGGVARSLMMVLFGFALAFSLLAAVAPEEIWKAKVQGLDFNLAFSETYRQMQATLSRISKAMWRGSPWCGVGAGAFGLHVPFLAEKADWAILPPKVAFALNGYWTMLAERGILGCLLPLAGAVLLLFRWVRRLVGAILYLKTQDDADIFVFACPPIVWMAPLLFAIFSVEAAFDSVFSTGGIFFALMAPLALSAASFPRKPRARTSPTDQES